MPEGFPGRSVNSFELLSIIPKEHQPAGGGQCSSPGVRVSDLGVSPGNFARGRVESQQYFASWLAGYALSACIVKRPPWPISLTPAAGEIQLALFEGDKI